MMECRENEFFCIYIVAKTNVQPSHLRHHIITNSYIMGLTSKGEGMVVEQHAAVSLH